MAKDPKSKTPNKVQKLSGNDKQRAKERDKATVDLKDSLSTTARAAGHSAEVLAADVVAGADRVVKKAKEKKAKTAKGREKAKSERRLPIPVVTAAVSAGVGLLVTWLRGRRAKNRET